jgi:hypothetical protein
MAQITAITLTDAASTPVARVFNPAKREGDVYRYDHRGGGIVAGYGQLTISQKLPSKTSKYTTVQMRLVDPILEQTSPSTSTGIQPAPTVAYSNGVEIKFTCHERSSVQDRKNLLAMVRDLVDEALTTNAVENYDFAYF